MRQEISRNLQSASKFPKASLSQNGALESVDYESLLHATKAYNEDLISNCFGSNTHDGAVDLESAALESKLVVSALRTYEQWNATPQARAISDLPIPLRKISNDPPTTGLPPSMQSLTDPRRARRRRPLGDEPDPLGSPNNGRHFGRGTRTIQLDLDTAEDLATAHTLLDDTHVLIQGFRPDFLAARILDPTTLAERYKHKERGIIVANMSAYGWDGPWSKRRGFNSLVQTCNVMNMSEAEHFGSREVARPMPAQALDHGGGYFLVAGILAALYRQASEGGSWVVDISLAGVGKYLRSLGQYAGKSGFEGVRDFTCTGNVPAEFLETRKGGFGTLTAVRHSVSIEGVGVV
ncbi:CoA-transferase family III-domain-containing protein [Aspergillus multicolor]|uniref:CAIB/BAIF family enzyme n=1 Tax=Aspergillus multicolor TaxID=41759 RepID=UPI003CCD1360